MGAYQTIRHDQLKNGDVAYVQGFALTVTNLRVEPWKASPEHAGRPTVRYEGICTADQRNDRIRNTSYNGGTYGAFGDIPVTIDARPQQRIEDRAKEIAAGLGISIAAARRTAKAESRGEIDPGDTNESIGEARGERSRSMREEYDPEAADEMAREDANGFT